MTSDGQLCLDECAFRGYSYAWCNTLESWGYCTPSSFLGKAHSYSLFHFPEPLIWIRIAGNLAGKFNFFFVSDFLSRLHTNGPGWEPNRLPNVTFDNQEINKLLVDEEPANIFDLPAPSSSTSTSMYTIT